eukprot:jgi/Botrbrau1/422/Bobra.110_2s0072.1
MAGWGPFGNTFPGFPPGGPPNFGNFGPIFGPDPFAELERRVQGSFWDPIGPMMSGQGSPFMGRPQNAGMDSRNRSNYNTTQGNQPRGAEPYEDRAGFSTDLIGGMSGFGGFGGGFPFGGIPFGGGGGSYSYSSSSYTVQSSGGVSMQRSSHSQMGPGGVLEHKESYKDSSGREEKTSRRQIGDKARVVKRVRGPNGQEDYREQFQGLDEVSASEFDREFEERLAASRFRAFSESHAFGLPGMGDTRGNRAPSTLQIEDVTDQDDQVAAAETSETARNTGGSSRRRGQPVRGGHPV